MFHGEHLPRPSGNPAADKSEACNPYSSARHKACEAQSDAEGEKDGPRRTCRHLNGLSLTLFHSAVIHYKSPSNQVNDCKHHDPHCIDEVPIKGDHTEAFTLSRVNPAEKRKDEDRGKEKHSDYDMGGV